MSDKKVCGNCYFCVGWTCDCSLSDMFGYDILEIDKACDKWQTNEAKLTTVIWAEQGEKTHD